MVKEEEVVCLTDDPAMRRTFLPQPLARLSQRLLALLCGILSITASFDSIVVKQVLDGSLPVHLAALPSLTEQEDPGQNNDDMLNLVDSLEVGGIDRKHERPLQVFTAGNAQAGRLPLSAVARIRTLLGHAGCEHARRNGVGVPLLC
jgi:hypothetical protein